MRGHFGRIRRSRTAEVVREHERKLRRKRLKTSSWVIPSSEADRESVSGAGDPSSLSLSQDDIRRAVDRAASLGVHHSRVASIPLFSSVWPSDSCRVWATRGRFSLPWALRSVAAGVVGVGLVCRPSARGGLPTLITSVGNTLLMVITQYDRWLART